MVINIYLDLAIDFFSKFTEFPGLYGVSSPTDDNQSFTIELTARLLNTTDVEIGETYYFGVSAELTDINTIYTAQKSLVAKEFNCTKVRN